MELVLQVADLSKALQRIQGIVEKKSTMPILANALFKVTGPDRVSVSATDLEIAHTAEYPVLVQSPGAMSIAAKSLYEIVRALPHSTVTLKQLTNQWIEITSGRVKYKVVGMPAESFPTLPSFESVPFFRIKPKIFKQMIDQVLYAVSTDDTRYNLTGVYCEPMTGVNGLRLVATDGHRLAVIERPTEGAPSMQRGVIIPRKGMIELRKLLDEGTDEGGFGFVENSAIFKKDGVTMNMRLVDGKFPDYQQVIPTASSKRIRVSRTAFLDALRRTSLLSHDKNQTARIEISAGCLAVSANNPDLGEAREELETDYAGEALKVGFSFRFLMDVLQVLTEVEVDFELTDDLSPGVLRGVGTEGYKAVIMPMRI